MRTTLITGIFPTTKKPLPVNVAPFQSLLGNMISSPSVSGLAEKIPVHLSRVAREKLVHLMCSYGITHSRTTNENREIAKEMLRDGYVTRNEWSSQFGDTRASLIRFCLFDRDGDGRLSESELRMREPTSFEQLTPEQRLKVASLYLSDRYGGTASQWTEAARDGNISRAEFRRISRSAALTNDAFRIIDRDNNNQITLSEIFSFIFLTLPYGSVGSCLLADADAEAEKLIDQLVRSTDAL